MKFHIPLLLAVAAALAAAQVVPADLSGAWVNQLGSVCVLECTVGGAIRGNYTTAVGSTNKTHPLVGVWAPGVETPEVAVVSLSVLWADVSPRAVTAWVGQYTATGQLKLQWLLAQETPAADAWASTLTNQDTFVKKAAE